MPTVPSYLMSRNGIWYFNYRIPSAVRKRHNLKKIFIRRSLRTTNMREAVLLSRDFISMVMGDENNILNPPEITKGLNRKVNHPHTQSLNSPVEDTVIPNHPHNTLSSHNSFHPYHQPVHNDTTVLSSWNGIYEGYSHGKVMVL